MKACYIRNKIGCHCENKCEYNKILNELDNETAPPMSGEKTGIYPLVGLSKPRTATLTGPKKDFFWASIEMPDDRMKALWDYCKGNWDEPKFAKIKYKELSEDGFPIDAIMIELVLSHRQRQETT